MTREERYECFQMMLPICISYIPIGIACGVVLQQAGFHWLTTLFMSIIVYAGASQFMIAAMMMSGAGIIQIVAMVCAMNSRHMLMSASLQGKLTNRKLRYLLPFAHLVTDETYAVLLTKYNTVPTWTDQQSFFASLFTYFTWMTSTMIGAFIGSGINLPTSTMSFMMTAMFLFLLLTQVKTPASVVVIVVTMLSIFVLNTWLPSGASILLASLIGSLAGYGYEKMWRLKAVNAHD